MTLPFDSAVRLLRALGLPLTPAETSPSRAPAGHPTAAPHVTFSLAAESEDFELAPYPSPRFSAATSNVNFEFDHTQKTRHIEDSDSQDYRQGRARTRIGTTGAVPSTSTSLRSRSTSPASSTCSSTAGWSDSDSSIARPRRKPRSGSKAKPTNLERDELEALWRRYWD